MPDKDIIDSIPATIVSPSRRGRKRAGRSKLLWTAGSLLALLLVSAVAGLVWLRSAALAALPVLDGELRVTGLSAPVTVRRDEHGVPHIEAASQDDLFLAQGYVTAQDRLWQMDAFRRNANGELAEVMGPSLVRHDKAQRVLQIRVTAERVYARLPTEERARMEAYARGVNLYIAQHENTLPPEFRLLHYKPQPWTGVDSVSVGLMMAEMLDMHWYTKLGRDHVAARLHDPKLEAELYPVGSWRDHPPTGVRVDLSQPQVAPAPANDDDDDEDDDRSQARVAPHVLDHSRTPLGAPSISRPLRNGWETTNLHPPHADQADEAPGEIRALLGLPACEGCAAGSNNWVIAGKHTASGKPLLANDMHLELTEPNIWYMADLKAPGFHAAGVTLPGMPYVIAGHNEHVAWGFTALYADVQDLYLEKLDGKGNYQDLDTQWKPLVVDHELIKVRAGRDVKLDVQLTAHGPLLNPILEKEKRPLALKWTIYDPALNELPLYQLNVASNWTEFSAALETWCWPTQNIVYSDDQGHIGYHAIGRVPIPFLGNLVPFHHENLDSRVGTNEWAETNLVPGSYLPFDLMPHAFDPPSGFLATANSRVTANDAPIPLTHEWVDPYRIERIYKSLDGRDQLKPADMLALQDDIYSEVDQELGHRFAYAIDHTPGADEKLKKAADLMRSWDGKLTTDSAAASIVTQARYAFWPLILKPKLGDDAAFYSWSESNFAEEEIIMHGNGEWLPASYKNWDALLTDAVRQGMKNGKAPGDIARWSYGSWHVIDIEHPLAWLLPLAGRVAGTGAQPLSGDTTTVKQVGRGFGPSQRFTMDWNDVDGSTENIVLGESGNPYSLYFRDQWEDYYSGTSFALPFSEKAVAAQTRHTLRLLP
ncbi:MAG: penicillin acylase family protein [Terracidiphilus sp.]|jgi:penicillin amidase